MYRAESLPKSEATKSEGAMDMLQFVKQHKALSLAFALAIIATLVFGARLTASMIYWSDPEHIDQPLAGWMTPRYLSKSWGVPPDVVATALTLERSGGEGRKTLAQIARQKDQDLDTLILDVTSAIEAFRNTPDE